MGPHQRPSSVTSSPHSKTPRGGTLSQEAVVRGGRPTGHNRPTGHQVSCKAPRVAWPDGGIRCLLWSITNKLIINAFTFKNL